MPPGLRFCSVDLHVHTPASRCFAEKGVTPETIVEQAIACGMHAIAITDHNTAEWVDRVKAVAADTTLTVFASVEITVGPGVHVLAIFPEDRTSAHITDLLAKLGLGADERGDQEALVTQFGIQAVVSMIREQGALPVLAHIDGPRGAWRELRESGQTLIQLWRAAEFAAVEIVGEGLPDEVGCAPFDYCPACYWASDNPHPDDPTKHSHLGIGTRYSRFKLDDPISWEGLRQCFQDPGVRIRPARPRDDLATSHPVIEGVRVEGGFLSGLDLGLNPNLNCVIGGRGTGKSTLLELIRHAFDAEPKTETNVRQAQGILENTFPPGSRVTVHFRLGDGSAYRLERISERPPQVFRGDGSEPLAVMPADLLPLQVYGQKEVYEISQDPAFQLRLLDNYVAEDLGPLRREEDELLRQLRDNAAEILRLEEDIVSAEEQLGELGAIEEELHRLEQQDFAARMQQKKLYDQEKRLVDQAEAQVSGLTEALDEFLQKQRLDVDLLGTEPTEGLPNQDVLLAQGELLRATNADMERSLNALKGRVQAKWGEGQAGRETWQAAYDAQDEAYQALLREFQESGEVLDPDRYIQLQNRKMKLEELDREVQKQTAEVARLHQARGELLVQLRAVRRRQYEVRRDKASELTRLLDGDVRITVHPQGHREAYKHYLRELFAGLNVRNPHRDRLVEAEADQPEQEAQRPVEFRGETRYLIPRIPRYLDPIDLAEAIRLEQERIDEEESLLESHFSVDSDAMRRNIAGLSQEKLFELETFAVPDLPVIQLRVASGELGYRPLSALSVGQKCTALLSLVLLESPATLLVDQPEDDLDNQFIFDQIVATLRREKERRQFLIATHNANIPVSGDAELIIVLEADERHGWVGDGNIGSIDTETIKQSVERILEGGENAFRIRKEKYGIR
jgi:PHP family Zn ribbon phosphoesterase